MVFHSDSTKTLSRHARLAAHGEFAAFRLHAIDKHVFTKLAALTSFDDLRGTVLCQRLFKRVHGVPRLQSNRHLVRDLCDWPNRSPPSDIRRLASSVYDDLPREGGSGVERPDAIARVDFERL